MRKKYDKNELILMEKISILDYYNEHIVKLKPKFRPMSEFKTDAICPLHEENDPSFHFWKERKIFNCFGCGVAGNIVFLHMLIRRKYYGEQLDNVAAKKSLAALYGIDLQEESKEDSIKSIFDEARALMTRSLVIPKDKFSLAEFRQLNNKLIDSSFNENIKVQNFEFLDAVACLVITHTDD